jgi:hypothetical protein
MLKALRKNTKKALFPFREALSYLLKNS